LSAALQSTEELPLFLCIGDLDVDVLIEVDRLPIRDGKVNGVVKQKAPGGMAGNVAAALARLGSRVRVLGRVGDDADGAFAVKSLEQVGVDTSFVSSLAGVATFSCISLLTPDGEKSLVKLMTAAYRPEASDVTQAALKGVRHLHLTSVGDPALCRRVVEAARTSGATASLDIERADCPEDATVLLDAVKGFDLIFCNAESRAFVDAALQRPLAGLVAALVTTLGADGAQVETAEGRISSPGFTPKTVDTTGAGDRFAAACLHARLAARLDWREAIRFANCAAAISTTGLGAQSALPTADQVVTYLSAEPTHAAGAR
jgi:ribokinase